MLENLNDYTIILASKSPRRKQLLEELGISFKIESKEVEEIFPDQLAVNQVPEYLAKLKATPFNNSIDNNTLVITSDTIVCVDDEILGKPVDYDEAFLMLNQLSGRSHQVMTGVHLLSAAKSVSFTSITTVYFKALSKEEIDYYITNYHPYDKAGAYGIQEWIGHIAVEQINGSYFNVMGLPVQRLYEELRKF